MAGAGAERRGGARQSPGVTFPHPARARRGGPTRREFGSAREGPDQDSGAGVPGCLRAASDADAGNPTTGTGGWKPARSGEAARHRLRAAACALPAFPATPLRAPARHPAPLAAASPLCRPHTRLFGPEAPPLRAGDWPAAPLVGGAPCRRGAVYSKGRACALR